MTHRETLVKLCEISRKVQEHYEFNFEADCFCGGEIVFSEYYRFSDEVLDFIKSAVEEKIAKEESCKSK